MGYFGRKLEQRRQNRDYYFYVGLIIKRRIIKQRHYFNVDNCLFQGEVICKANKKNTVITTRCIILGMEFRNFITFYLIYSGMNHSHRCSIRTLN